MPSGPIYNVLVTGASSTNSIDFIRALKKQTELSLRICATDIYEKNLSIGSHFSDSFYQVPPAKDPEFVNKLLEICKVEQTHILVPIIDEEFGPILQNRSRFEQNKVKVVLPEETILSATSNKLNFHNFLLTNGFNSPALKSTPFSSADLPLITKPIHGRGSQGVKIIRTAKDLENFQLPADYIVQKMVSGTEFTIDTFSDLNGKTLVAVPRIRMEIRDGKSVRAQIQHNELIEIATKSICDKLKMTGPACLQCILTSDNTPYFFDFNSRIGSATRLTVEAGVNIPFLAIKSLLNLKIEQKELQFENNIIMLRYLNEVFTKA